ncbi:MAG TPA: hypothetical protein VGB08_04020 [Allosphingosinicella sp.]
MARSAALAALLFAAAACDEVAGPQAAGGGSTTPRYERAADAGLTPGDMPVRIGELGPNFPACYAMARFRDRVVAENEAVPVRAAPFDQARETTRLAASAQFFICTRSHDQRWLAAVWDEAEGASPDCGVSQPVSARRDYGGPCRSGWIPATLVRFESGIIHRDPGQANSSD